MAATNAPVSVVIPIYNRGGWIAETLQSILGQTLPPAEVIVVDDGSTDDVAAVVARFPTVRLIRQANAGVSTARNRGVEAATQPFIAFCDSDDTWYPHKLEREMPLFDDEEVGVVYGDADVCMVATDGTRRLRLTTRFGGVAPHSNTFADLIRINPVPFSTVVARRSLFDFVKFDPRADGSEDWAWLCRASLRCRIAVIREVLGEYRVHGENKSGDFDAHFVEHFARCQDMLDDVQGANRDLVLRELALQRLRWRLKRIVKRRGLPLPEKRPEERHGPLRFGIYFVQFTARTGRLVFSKLRRRARMRTKRRSSRAVSALQTR